MIQQKALISKTSNSIVSIYYDEEFKKTVCEKLLSTESQDKFQRYCNEIDFLKYLKNSRFVITYLCHKKECRFNNYTCRIITDYCENGNLSKYTETLVTSNKEYKHSIKYYIKTFISFFSDLQFKGIAHRDIKPENIFITADGQMKIGDFGSSIFKRDTDFYTIQGTAYYLSPELRKGFSNYLNRNGNVKIIYCPFKSDVFSLGLVFLGMARMQMVMDITENISELEENIKNYLLEVSDPTVKEIISLMLTIQSNDRPDFIKLNSIVFSLLGEVDSKCIICETPGNVSTYFCLSCNHFIHKACLAKSDDFSCHLCSSPLKIRCFTCLKFFESVSVENQCEICSLIEELDLVTFVPTADEPKAPLTYICKRDRTEIELLGSSQAYRCMKCYRNYCSVCKQSSHGDTTCFKLSSPYVFFCKCTSKIVTYELDGIFFMCQNCGFRCMVCFKSLNSDHIRCARSLEIRKYV